MQFLCVYMFVCFCVYVYVCETLLLLCLKVPPTAENITAPSDIFCLH